MLVRAVSFILLPLFSNKLTESEYGTYSIILIFIAFAQFLYSYGMDASLMKFFVKYKGQIKKVYSSIFISILITSIILSGMIWLLSGNISILLLNDIDGNLIKIASVILFLDSFSFRILVIHRMEGYPLKYFILTLSNVLVTLSANFYLVFSLNMGVTGAMYATLLGSITTFVLALPYIINRIQFSEFSFSTLQEILKFGLPFLPSIIFQMVLDFSDRIILLKLTNLDMVGIYSAGYKVGGVMLILISGFRLGWEPYFLKLEDNEKRSRIISAVATNIIMLQLSILLFTILFAELFLTSNILGFSLLGKDFWQSIDIIPIVMVGYVFLGIYYLQMPGIFYYEKTFVLPFFRGFAAISNILLNFLLIPIFGIFGAAYATAIAFFLMCIPMYLYTNKLFSIKYQWGRIIVFSMLIGSIYIWKEYCDPEISLSLLAFIFAMVFPILTIIQSKRSFK